MIPIARESMFGSVTVRVFGTNPAITSRHWGCAIATVKPMQTTTIAVRPITKASSWR